MLTQLLKHIDEGHNDDQLSSDRTALSDNHYTNWSTYVNSLDKHEQEVPTYKKSSRGFKQASNYVASMARSSVRYACRDSLVSAPASGALSYTRSLLEDHHEIDNVRIAKRTKFSFNDTAVSSSSPAVCASASDRKECFLPGFGVPNLRPGFVGQCSICHRSSVLALLLKVQNLVVAPNKNAISEFLCKIGLDEIFKRICCDACASYLIEPSSSLLTEPVSSAVALVGIKENMDLWLKGLNGIFAGAHVDVLKEKWLEYFEDRLHEILLQDQDTAEKTVFKDALSWVAKGFGESVETGRDDASGSGFTIID